MNDRRIPTTPRFADLRNGLVVGIAGGTAEIAVVGLYSASSGTDGSAIARAIASTVGFTDPSAVMGVAAHMVIAAGLGIVLTVAWQTLGARHLPRQMLLPVMLASLALIWAVNFFIVLPAIGSGVATMLPHVVTLASKLAFGAAAALSLSLVQPAAARGRSAAFVTLSHTA
jgi:hypothetical protein